MTTQQVILAIPQTIIFPGLIFTAVVGLFLVWVDRKVTALIQSRMGPPWWQCYADVLKLMAKQMILPRGSRRAGFIIAPLVGLAGASLAATIVWSANLWHRSPFVGDLIVVVYLLAMPALALIIGGAASKSPFGAIGAGREMQMVLAYELPFVLAIIVPIIKVSATAVTGVTSPILLADVVKWQAAEGTLALTPSCAIALVVAFFCMHAKLGYLPFDQAEAETEIIGGPLAEYSGPGLALFKITNAMMLLVMPVFLITMYLGGIGLNMTEAGVFEMSASGVILFVVKFLVLFVLVVVIKSTHARLRIDQVLRLYWCRLTGAALIAIGLAWLGW